MLSGLHRQFASLSTAKKLSLGFGVVLVLTILVAVTAFWALQALSQRSALLERMSGVNTQVLQLRLTQQAFALRGDKTLVEQLHEQAVGMLEHNNALRSDMSEAEGVELDAVDQALDSFRNGFDRYVELRENMHMALDAANWLVVSAANSLDLLSEGLAEDGLDRLRESQGLEGDAMVVQAGQISKIYQLILKAMDQARVQLENSRSSGDATLAKIAEADEAQKLAAELSQSMSDPGYVAVLGEVIGNLNSFTERLNEYSGLVQQQQQEYLNLVQQADRMLDQVEQAYAQQQAQLSKQLQRSTWLIVVAAGLALLLGLLSTLTITVLIVRPLRDVTAQAQRIASGDLSVRIEVSRRDEIGQLQTAMADMAQNLRDMVGQLQNGVEQISTSAQSLSLATEQTRVGVNGQKQETEQVATAMTQMSATVYEVARNAETAAASTAQADQRVSNGVSVVQQTLARIDELSQALDVSASSIQQLSQETQRIESVLDVIKAVADQTNLLALNAAIEAARAGEQGRGFAVVADEVRALAQRTRQSTAEIEGLIGALREGSQHSVNNMTRSGGLIGQVVQDARDTEAQLTQIAEAVSQIYEMNQQIAAAAEQQTAVADEISHSVTSIRGVAEQSALAMDESAGASIRLAQLGSSLQEMAGRFRL
ncbi:methyl-accepting chemotaxis protein [Ectopseudomonas mendocina]|uniref:Methyl-accepting chemotaxis protein n=1 Tax=Ectopseudomonas mendocina TaxID=300 RepID=A0ABZ2RL78_ECTME